MHVHTQTTIASIRNTYLSVLSNCCVCFGWHYFIQLLKRTNVHLQSTNCHVWLCITQSVLGYLLFLPSDQFICFFIQHHFLFIYSQHGFLSSWTAVWAPPSSLTCVTQALFLRRLVFKKKTHHIFLYIQWKIVTRDASEKQKQNIPNVLSQFNLLYSSKRGNYAFITLQSKLGPYLVSVL